jgi:pimeloyl-ACP methyl ester carboxylesterase
LILLVFLLSTKPLIGQEFQLKTPYPIIFVHGLNGDPISWTSDGYDIIKFLRDGTTPLSEAQEVKITLDYDRSTSSLSNTKEADVHLFDKPKQSDLYIVNFNVHASGSPAKTCIGKTLSDVSKTDVNIPIKTDPNNYHVGDIIRINNELMLITAIGISDLTVIRPILGTEAKEHGELSIIYNLSNESNQSAIAKQGWGLKLIIDAVKEINKINKVILVGHSMGGLAIREYIRSYYQHDVAKIVTIGSPHYGSNLSDIPLDYIQECDNKSDAVRDLRTTITYKSKNFPYGDEDALGFFLYGGNESNIPDIYENNELLNYYSKDINANGLENDKIIGINDFDLCKFPSDVSKIWIASDRFKSKQFLYLLGDNDGVVLTKSQYIYSGDTLMVHNPHNSGVISVLHLQNDIRETSNISAIIRGLDEPNDKELAYEINEESINKGFITFGTYYNPVDIDLYKVNLSKDGLLKIRIDASSFTGITAVILKDEDDNIIKSITDISKIIEYHALAGIYYIQIRGIATDVPGSYLFPYILNTSFEAAPVPALSFYPAGSIPFYDVVLNSNRAKTVQIKNNGESIVNVSGLYLTGINRDQFSIGNTVPFDIPPGGHSIVTVNFNPTSIGEKSASLEIISSSGSTLSKTISLSGNGVDTPTRKLILNPSDIYNYGTVNINSTKANTFTFQNIGSDLLTVEDLTLMGNDPASFSFSDSPSLPFGLGWGEEKSITVMFSPLTLGSKSSDLIIVNNSDNLSPQKSLFLYGSGLYSIYTGSTNSLVAFEYWFDNNYLSKRLELLPFEDVAELSASIPATDLNQGLHSFHIRFKDKKNQWGSVYSEYIYKMSTSPDTTREIARYEYWLDDDYSGRIFAEVSQEQTFSFDGHVEIGNLQEGMHNFHIRYQDDGGSWSSVFSEFIYKMPNNPDGQKTITEYEYWFDDGYSEKVSQQVAPEETILMTDPLNSNSLSSGLHSMHVRFKDNGGAWSSVFSEFIYKLPATNLTPNHITAYRYWFDREETAIPVITLPATTNPLELIRNIKASGLTEGAHTVHFQFRDKMQAWSSVLTDTFNISGTLIQFIPLSKGWNIFSTGLNPANPEFKAVSQSLINDGSLVKIQDESGNSVEDNGLFGGWVNNIGGLSLTEGYKVNVKNDCEMQITGISAAMPMKIPLTVGWNIIGYPRFSDVDALTAIQQLVDHKSLIKVQDELGNSIEDFGLFGGWQNHIGSFMPGEGYKLKVSSPDTLTILESYSKSGNSITRQFGNTSHFQSVAEGNGVDHMNINLVEIPTDMLQVNDELGVFDNDFCVGGIRILNTQQEIRNLSIPSSSDDGTGKHGFTVGNKVLLKIWKSAENKEYSLEPEIVKGTFTFVKHESTFMSLAKYNSTGLGNSLMPSGVNLKIYPNPTDGKVYINYLGNSLIGMTVSVVNVLGEQILSQVVKTNPAVVNLTGLAKGVYNIQIMGDNWSKTEKVVLR